MVRFVKVKPCRRFSVFARADQRGQSLVQVLVALGVGSILLMSLLSMLNFMQSSSRSMAEKLAALDFQQQLLRVFADGSLCSQLLTTPTPLTFTANSASGNQSIANVGLSLTKVPLSTAAGAPDLAVAGEQVSPVSNTLFFAPGQPFHLTNITGSISGGVGNYTADFTVDFDQSRLVRGIKPATVKIGLLTASVGVNQTVTSCAGNYSTQVSTGQVLNGNTVPMIPGFSRSQCALSVSIEDAHYGNPYTSSYSDVGMWGDNHYGGAQAYYDANWRVTCRFLWSSSATWNSVTSSFENGDPPDWEDASCRYMVVCNP